jgi:hypothetical protein
MRRAAPMKPPAKETRLRFWEGRSLYVFAASPDHTVFIGGHNVPLPTAIGDAEAVASAARRLLSAAQLVHAEVLQAYDFYWYAHHNPRPLPVLRVRLDDSRGTWFHIHPPPATCLSALTPRAGGSVFSSTPCTALTSPCCSPTVRHGTSCWLSFLSSASRSASPQWWPGIGCGESGAAEHERTGITTHTKI